MCNDYSDLCTFYLGREVCVLWIQIIVINTPLLISVYFDECQRSSFIQKGFWSELKFIYCVQIDYNSLYKSSSFISNALNILLLVGKWLQTNKHFIIFKDIASEIECNIFAQNCEYRSFSNANTKEVRDNFIYQVINENGANCTFKNYLRHCGICFLSIIRIYCVIKGISQHDWQCLLQR